MDLLPHLPVAAHLVRVRGEVAGARAAPSSAHRARCPQHPGRPSVAETSRLSIVPRASKRTGRRPAAPGDRRSPPSSTPIELAGSLGPVGRSGRLSGKPLSQGPINPIRRRVQTAASEALAAHQRADRGGRGRAPRALGARPARRRTRMREQMRGAVVVPVGPRQRREVVLPTAGPATSRADAHARRIPAFPAAVPARQRRLRPASPGLAWCIHAGSPSCREVAAGTSSARLGAPP